MDLARIFAQAAQRYGVPVEDLQRTAQVESSLNPRAQNPKSSAGGLFQFVDKTWGQYGNGQDRFDPAASADAAARLMRDNRAAFAKRFGREPTGAEVYLMHQQGQNGALRLLEQPDLPAINLVGADAIRLNGGHPGMTARDFANLWMSKFGGAPKTQAVVNPPVQVAQRPEIAAPAEEPALNLGRIVASLGAQQQPAAQMRAPEAKPLYPRKKQAQSAFSGLRGPLKPERFAVVA